MRAWAAPLLVVGCLLSGWLMAPSTAEAFRRAKKQVTKTHMKVSPCVRVAVCKPRVNRVCHILAVGDARDTTAKAKPNTMWVVVQRQECSKRCVRICARNKTRALKSCKLRIKRCKKKYKATIKRCRAKAKKRCKSVCKRVKDRACKARCLVRIMKKCLLPLLKSSCPRHPKVCEAKIKEQHQACRYKCCKGKSTTHVCQQTYKCKCKTPCKGSNCPGCVCSCDWPICQQVSFVRKPKARPKRKSKSKRRMR